MSKAIFIEPFDVLLFRESKPFSGGEDHLARSIFPPPPSTVYAALRSHLLSCRFGRLEAFKESQDVPAELAVEIGSPQRFGTLALRCLFVARKQMIAGANHQVADVESFYPLPSDIAQIKGSQSKEYVLLTPVDGFPVLTDLPPGLQPLWFRKELHLEGINGWLTKAGMQRYLEGNADSLASFFASEEVITGDEIGKCLFTREARTGIARDRARRSAREGLLYSIEYIRVREEIGFLAEFDGTRLLPDTGLINLGGDRRPAHYQPAHVSPPNLDKVKEQITKHRRFKLALTAPALFENGWRPQWLDPHTLVGSYANVRVKLIAVALGKSVGIGGFDLVKQHPKPVHRFVPAGSVYFFELLGGDADAVRQAFHGQSISEAMPDFPETAKQGFGHSLIGAW